MKFGTPLQAIVNRVAIKNKESKSNAVFYSLFCSVNNKCFKVENQKMGVL